MERSTTGLLDDLPWPPGEENTERALEHTYDLLRKVDEKLDRVMKKLDRLRPEIPSDRLYTYEEAGVRIYYGREPEYVEPEHWSGGLSRKSVQRLVNDGDCPLRAVTVGGTRRITEAAIQQYLEGIEKGWIDGYQVKHPRKS